MSAQAVILDETVTYCGQELKDQNQCFRRFKDPQAISQNCQVYINLLMRCVKARVPSYVFLREACGPSMDELQDCILKATDSPTKTCADLQAKVWSCRDKFMEGYIAEKIKQENGNK
ncbi:hypothetical protein LIPSTDRAFT_113834 [Lipomyces starkeyi NRRL Y-11557]|uniref:IMS import disulfide relay-system CHCH-CHCH-like Cx9C domain-containing protein n=1 Tax=Lipomyces starkeyi NRRL Y-11557 TaxID=675824 RepID=A0A1E3PYL6_LIPST|nr:hypothetical protein LIPSTDRAFT_113834 [Lipomyces starkeyi NRRL Y-11557]